jgi:hypothetical protein
LPAEDSEPDHEGYRKEARRLRALAAEVRHAHARKQLLMIAALYDKLADHARRVRNAVSDNDL